MKHFNDTEWIDFVRNLVAPAQKAAMQGHINDGCKKCSATLHTWQNVSSIAAAETALDPPADIVRIAKSQFAVLGPSASGPRLVFDSMLQPLTAGTRGSVSARQFLYETDEYYIDLRLEPRPEAERACLIGQVLRRSKAERTAPGLAVRLQRGSHSIAHTSTNEFGEFQLEFAAANSLWLSISQGEAPEIVLPLYGVSANSLTKKDLN